METVANYKRFYALFRRMAVRGDREECRRQLVLQYTSGRTDSLREMDEREYKAMCCGLEEVLGGQEELKKLRSRCLKKMQMLGVETYDWNRVDKYCCDPRIAGKKFAWLSVGELEALELKLWAMLYKKKKSVIKK